MSIKKDKLGSLHITDKGSKGMIRLSKSCLSRLEKESVAKVLDSEFLGMGSEVKKFEDDLTEFFGRPVLCVSTGTAALHLALQAIGLGKGDEVLVQSLTYVASFQAISATGAKAVACEVNLDNLCIDLDDAKTKLTKNTKAIMPVHYSGGVGDLYEVYLFAEKHGLRVIEDAAHAFGTKYNGEKVGSFGDITCFSFDGIKNITSGEGGAVLTNDKKVAQRLKDDRLLGVQKDTEMRYNGQRSWDFDVYNQGFRFHMSNINAAIGIEQLKKIDFFKRKRQEIAQHYIKNLKKIKYIDFLKIDFLEIIPHIFVVKTSKRDELKEYLAGNGIECGIHYKPNHLLSKYDFDITLPITEHIYSEILTLPCHTDLTTEEQNFVIDSIRKFYGC